MEHLGGKVAGQEAPCAQAHLPCPNLPNHAGERFSEGVNINMGLLALGNVINALTEGKGRT